MPHNPVTVRNDIIEKTLGNGHDLVVRTIREAPADDDGNPTTDPFNEYDEWVANRMMNLLTTVYPGYPWRVIHNTAFNPRTSRYDKIALVSIPILMGIANYIAINDLTDDITPGLVIASGHEILERYKLPERFHLDRFLEAREQHSALVLPSRAVPE